MHFLTFPWKLMFALCPPAGLCNGWPCFVISLMAIGFQARPSPESSLQP